MRRALIGMSAVLLVVALTFVVVPLGYAILLIPFLEHDARNMPVEPAWTSRLAIIGGTALVSVCTGYVLGRAGGFRFAHGLGTGIAAGIALAVFWYAKEALRGYLPDTLSALTGLLFCTTDTALFMALGASAGYRSFEPRTIATKKERVDGLRPIR